MNNAFHMWLGFALVTPLFWSFVHVMDSHCVDEIFEKPWMGVVIGAATSALVYLFLPILLFYPGLDQPHFNIVLHGLLAGVLIQISQAFYFKALSYSDAGIVASYWNITPALLPIAGFFLFRTILKEAQYLGIALLILASIIFCLIDSNFKTRWRAFFLMIFASALQVIALLEENYVYENTGYFTGFYIVITGLIVAGFFPLLFRRARRRFSNNLHILRPAIKIFVVIELANLAALATSQRAIDLGEPSLVAAVETMVPAYVFIISLLLMIFASKYGDKNSVKKLPIKFALVALMAIGVYCL